jgi:hypothetical protein
LFRVETVELKYIHIGIGVCVDLPYFVKIATSDYTTKFSETDIINMLQSLIDNKGNNKITELRKILQRESQNS